MSIANGNAVDPDELLRERGVEVDWEAAKARASFNPELYAIVNEQLESSLATAARLRELGRGIPDPPSPFIDWSAFWEREHNEAEWTYPDVLAKGRGHALYATHKEGKSLFCLSMAAQIAMGQESTAVVYLDYEMTEADVHERLEEMGYGPQSDLSRLRYCLLPQLSPLDTTRGADELCEMVDAVAEQFPDCHLAVIIDTFGRSVRGPEDEADTTRAFYQHSGIALKRRGVTWARLDHAGKDVSRGQRGSSAKGDDVDVIWRLAKSDRGIVLTREASRMSWVPQRVVFVQTDDPLVYVRSKDDWPAGTGELANILDRLKVPVDASVKAARIALKSIGEGRRNDLVAAAMRWRKHREDVESSGSVTHRVTPGNAITPLPGNAEEEFAF